MPKNSGFFKKSLEKVAGFLKKSLEIVVKLIYYTYMIYGEEQKC